MFDFQFASACQFVVYYREVLVLISCFDLQRVLLEKVEVPKVYLHFGHCGSEAVLYLFPRLLLPALLKDNFVIILVNF